MDRKKTSCQKKRKKKWRKKNQTPFVNKQTNKQIKKKNSVEMAGLFKNTME